MESKQQRIIKGFNIFKSRLLVILAICLLSTAICAYLVPFWANNSISEQEINNELNNVSTVYGGALTFSVNEILASIISFLNLSVMSTMAIVIAYIVKQAVDKKLFRFNRWRDWRFFIYASGLSMIIIDLGSKFVLSSNIWVSLVSTIIAAFIITIISALLLPEELPEVKII